ncbi:hypothetical protein CEE45_16355 [Candidatus Heimdallarchaeota archaeon B3_Heim]|nr:MAG: hypothetical protein CEE45_16355 [Candidatus Heimdallarchaeota archaeon B3_Heim]
MFEGIVVVKSLKNENRTFDYLWGIFLLLEIFSGEFFKNYNPFVLLQILGFFFLLLAISFIPIPLILFPRKRDEEKYEHFFDVPHVIKTGIYGLVRHPQYLGWIFVIIGLFFIRQEPVGALFGIFGLFFLNYCVENEENNLIKKFGKEYELYKATVPRWNLILGFYRYFKKDS